MYRRFILLAAGLLVACSPSLNWRTVTLADGALSAHLPCKPTHMERRIELVGAPTQVRMAACEADGSTFAVACTQLADPSQVGMALAHWRTAVLASMAAGAPQDSPFVPPGALVLPQSVRTVARGQLPGGAPVALQAVWFARVQGPQISACHAVLYGAQVRAAVADSFFAGLVLAPR